MPKRKSQIEDDVFAVDDEPPQSMSKNGKPSRKKSDVVDNARQCELPARCELAKPEQKKSAHPTLEATVLDQSSKDTPDPKINTIAERVRRSDLVDATPPNCDEYPVYEATPPGITAEMPVSKTAERYNMSHPKRGTCLVFNHEKFEEETLYREGSNVDVERIDATFSRLGFDVIVQNDLKYDDVMKKIGALSRPENHVDKDCVCVFVLTHGQENGYIEAKDVAYRSNKIWELFTADKCPTLAGKPKLFFFQACRGQKLDSGVRVMKRSELSHVSDQADSIITSYTIPTLADFMIAHSCAEGFYSWRNPENGTWYVQSLCEVLNEFSETTDLLKMLTITSRRVATDYKSYDETDATMNAKKQVPSVTSTLTRDLYFTPK